MIGPKQEGEMRFVKHQRIRVNSPEYPEHRDVGFVAKVDRKQDCYWCWLDAWRYPVALDESELEPESKGMGILAEGEKESYKAARAAVPWKPGMPSPEDAIKRGRE